MPPSSCTDVGDPKRCPFCGSTETTAVSDFGTSLMVRLCYCRTCKSHFEAIKWGEAPSAEDVPPFLREPHPPKEA